MFKKCFEVHNRRAPARRGVLEYGTCLCHVPGGQCSGLGSMPPRLVILTFHVLSDVFQCKIKRADKCEQGAWVLDISAPLTKVGDHVQA